VSPSPISTSLPQGWAKRGGAAGKKEEKRIEMTAMNNIKVQNSTFFISKASEKF
jgi:hypothetical protein